MSTANASSKNDLEKQIVELQKELDLHKTKLSEAESMVVAMQTVGHLVGENPQEQPTGRTVSVEVCLNPHEKDVKKQLFKTVEKPTYFYTLNLPVSVVSLSTNGFEYYHGQTYEFDIDTLAEMKSRVARCWDHERSINGNDENAYRKQQQAHLRAVR